MPRAFISVGSNIDPDTHVRQAVALIAARTHLVAISTVYQTDAVDRPEQDPYYNCVLQIETGLRPREVKRAILRPIEDKLGRMRTADRYAPRTVDLDLIVYDDMVLEEDGMRLPDPDISERPFLAHPLAELAPGWMLAGSNRPIEDVAAALSTAGMRPLVAYAQKLRQEFLS
jgi:2-amino-4-hydroxy-6-hydroxymethyldihydropteridine diphosphokinase